jgi:predicted PurR-regulated permease PerM
MAEDTPDTSPTADAQPAGAPRRPNLTILLIFVGVFLALLIVFRTVLFPFLLAIFLAYLVEPVVAWGTRSRIFGIKWTRAPVLVLVYAIVVGGAVFGAVKGLTALAGMVRDNSQQIAEAARQETPRAVFALPDGQTFDTDIVVPKDTQLRHEVAGDVATYVTKYPVRIEAGKQSASTLLLVRTEAGERVPAIGPRRPQHPSPKFGDALDVVHAHEIKFADDKPLDPSIELTVTAGLQAKGLEILLEERLVTPIVVNLGKAGVQVEPSGVREFISLKADALSEDLPERLGKGALSFAGKITLAIYEFFLILMLTAFIVTDRKRIANYFASLPPPNYRASYLKLVDYIDDGLAGVIRGQLVICGVNGVLTYIGLVLLGVKGAVMLSVIAAILSLIPIFGTIVSSIPIVLIAATDGIDTGILALLWIVFIHLLEANVLNPLIMGSHAEMHPVIIVFALLAGEHSFGVFGALLAVPTMSIIQSCFRFYRHEIEGIPREEPKPHGEWFRNKLGGMWAKLTGKGGEASA